MSDAPNRPRVSQPTAVTRHLVEGPPGEAVDLAPAGTEVATGQRVPAAGVWAVAGHLDGADCPSTGERRALAARDEAPSCPEGHAVTWRLDDLAPSAAAIRPTR